MRLVLLPQHKPASEKSLSSDAKEKENEVQFKYLQGFLRFLETVNRIRRPPVTSLKVVLVEFIHHILLKLCPFSYAPTPPRGKFLRFALMFS